MKNDRTSIYPAYDVVVVGAGHAGCEAALIAARMGAKTLLATMNLFTVAQMSCNPAMGGLAKGHLIREIDALGGAMGRITDQSGIQFRMLNRSKGPAVQAPRAQCDRMDYSWKMRLLLESQENLHLKQMWVDGLVVTDKRMVGIRLKSGTTIRAKAVILTAGTFLNARMYAGLEGVDGGRAGEATVAGISKDHASLGFRLARHKTGTPPRIDGKTVDFSSMEIQHGEDPPPVFSYQSGEISVDQLPCYLTSTHEDTHEILRSGLDQSPMFTGLIKGVGPRYCPSIEDKIVRFSDKPGHQIFLEPEGRQTREMYVNGFSTSLPEWIQIQAIRSIPGLEKVEVTRLGYAVEYDFFPTDQIKPTLETKPIPGLYFAGQVNGTSGYEEAGAQGLMAGINAVLKIRGEAPLVLGRSDGYIGVLVDDLVTQCPEEPYRMFTSRAEYRLLLRQDNADLRLLRFAEQYELLPPPALERARKKQSSLAALLDQCRKTKVHPDDIAETLKKHGSSSLQQSESLYRLLKRPELPISDLRRFLAWQEGDQRLEAEILQQLELEIKYEGYIRRQDAMVKKFQNLEGFMIPDTLDYGDVTALAGEATEKLTRYRPRSLGQASRISGVTPSDVSVLMVYLSGAARVRERAQPQ